MSYGPYGSYGSFNTWNDATKTLARILVLLPDQRPVKLWPVVTILMGEEHKDWTRGLIQQFEHNGALMKVGEGPLTECPFYIQKNIMHELGWC